jgi:hypothetical protein
MFKGWAVLVYEYTALSCSRDADWEDMCLSRLGDAVQMHCKLEAGRGLRLYYTTLN